MPGAESHPRRRRVRQRRRRASRNRQGLQGSAASTRRQADNRSPVEARLAKPPGLLSRSLSSSRINHSNRSSNSHRRNSNNNYSLPYRLISLLSCGFGMRRPTRAGEPREAWNWRRRFSRAGDGTRRRPGKISRTAAPRTRSPETLRESRPPSSSRPIRPHRSEA